MVLWVLTCLIVCRWNGKPDLCSYISWKWAYVCEYLSRISHLRIHFLQMKNLSSGLNTLIFIWLKGFIQIHFLVILHNITVPCLLCEISLEDISWPCSTSPTPKVPLWPHGWISLAASKYLRMLKYAGDEAKLYSKVSSVIQTQNLKPDVNINKNDLGVEVPAENKRDVCTLFLWMKLVMTATSSS